MALVNDWELAEAALPARWAVARALLELEEPGRIERVTALLAPLQPLRSGEATVAIRIDRRGAGPSPEALRRALARLDAERLHGTISIDAVEAEPAGEAARSVPVPAPTLAKSWDAALADLPADWSDLLGEIELDSSDYRDAAAVQLAPLNTRLAGEGLRLQFRSARRFGFGASTGMVRRCLERCDTAGMRGRVRVVRVLSDTQPVATQGPVWQIDGRMV